MRKDSKQVRFTDIHDFSKGNQIIQSEDNCKQHIIDLSLRYNILCPYTAFIGIEKHLDNNPISGEVPILLSTNNRDFRSVSSKVAKLSYDIDNLDLYPSTVSINQSLDQRPTHFERYRELLPTMNPLTNDNNISYYQEQKPREYIKSHCNASSRAQRSVINQVHSLTLSNDRKFKESNMHKKTTDTNQDEIRSINDKNHVGYLIGEQTKDGPWNFNSNR